MTIDNSHFSSLSENGLAQGNLSCGSNFLLEYARSIGEIYCPDTMSPVQTLTSRTKESSPKNTYSGNYGTSLFPYHSDMAHWYIPPRYILLVCDTPDPQVSTGLVTWATITPKINPKHLTMARFVPRRRLNGNMYTLRIKNKGYFRWDNLFIEPSNKHGEYIKEAMKDIDLTSFEKRITLNNPGDFILFDNWKMLHSRSHTRPDSPRIIKRLYFKGFN